jgi:AcrR family transcriptional regulator
MGKKTTPEHIYETAIKVFAQYGFQRTRIEDITGRLNIATGTLYLYVENKQDLYEKTVSHAIKKWQGKVFETIADIDDITERLLAMCKKGYGYLSEDVHLRQVLINDPSIFPLTPRKVRFPEIDTASVHLIKDTLEKGISKQVFRNIDVDHIAEFFYSIYVMFIIKTYVKSEGQSAQKMFDEGLDLMLYGLIKK